MSHQFPCKWCAPQSLIDCFLRKANEANARSFVLSCPPALALQGMIERLENKVSPPFINHFFQASLDGVHVVP